MPKGAARKYANCGHDDLGHEGYVGRCTANDIGAEDDPDGTYDGDCPECVDSLDAERKAKGE
jgi:hypothetical protein